MSAPRRSARIAAKAAYPTTPVKAPKAKEVPAAPMKSKERLLEDLEEVADWLTKSNQTCLVNEDVLEDFLDEARGKIQYVANNIEEMMTLVRIRPRSYWKKVLDRLNIGIWTVIDIIRDYAPDYQKGYYILEDVRWISNQMNRYEY